METAPIPGFSPYVVLRETNADGFDVQSTKTGKYLKTAAGGNVALRSVSRRKTTISIKKLRRSLFPDVGEHHMFEHRSIPGFSKYSIYKFTTPGGVDVFKNDGSGYPMKPIKNAGGYMYTSAKNDANVRKHILIGRTRLLTFAGPPPDPSWTCDHINRIRVDDSLENLRWATPSDQLINRDKWRSNPGCKVGIKKTNLETGEVIRFSSVSDVPGATRDSVARAICKRIKLSNCTFEHDTLVPIEGEEFKRARGTSKMWISNQGRVARMTPHGLVQIIVSRNSEYPRIGIDGKPRSLHRVVYETFVGPVPDGYVVDHINEDKGDFRLENLRVVTHSQNTSFSQGFVYRLRNKITGEIQIVVGQKRVSEIVGFSQAYVGYISNGKSTNATWDIEKLRRAIE